MIQVVLEDALRYRVGCPGMFELGTDYGVHDELDALEACLGGPPGCEVYDTIADKWIGPYGPEDEAWIRDQLSSRV